MTDARDNLPHILEEHRKWRMGKGGARANLTDANLADANLADANLTGANLTDANLARAYLADAKIAGQGASLLRAVSRNDDIKRTVGKGKGLGLLLRALDEHSNDVYVCVQSLQCLSVLC